MPINEEKLPIKNESLAQEKNTLDIKKEKN